MLADVLRRRTPLPIEILPDAGQTETRPGVVYVVASNRQVLVRDGHLVVESDGSRPRPSIDLLLTTAAEAYGERLVAVILTGRGSDGAAGAVEVKNAGGVVVVQNPHTPHRDGPPAPGRAPRRPGRDVAAGEPPREHRLPGLQAGQRAAADRTAHGRRACPHAR
jgi:chemotaxis response regulator CheB